jgi:hypothetical protein
VTDPAEEESYRSQRRFIFAATLAVIVALIVTGLVL